MGIRYSAEVVSQYNDTQYAVAIYDTSFSGTIQTIELSGDAFSIEYERQGDEKFTPIKGSKCTLYVRVTDDAVGLDLQSWLNSVLLSNNEDKFQIAILRDSQLFWVGNILHDLSGRADDSRPYDFNLTATDGLARLKDFEFTYATTNNDRYKMIDYIYEVLKKTPLYTLNIATNLYSTCVEWWEDSMPARAANKDPLDFTKVHCYAFTTFDEKKQERTALTYYQVLEEICRHWGMRVIMSEGMFKFVQVNNYVDDGTTKYERVYTRLNAYTSNAALPSGISLQTSSPIRRVLAGNQWNYFAPLKNVFRRFPFVNLNMLNGEQDMPYSVTLPANISGTTGSRLVFNMGIDWQVTSGSFAVGGYRLTLRLTINLNNDYWLKGSNATGIYTWETTPEYVEFTIVRTSYFVLEDTYISLITPVIPSGVYGSNTFEIEDIGVVHVPTNTSVTYDIKRVAASSSLKYNTEDTGQNQSSYKYQMQNTLTVINSYDLDLGNAIMGEMFFSEYYGGLYVFNGTSYVPSTSKWRIYDTGYDDNFIATLLIEVMAAQTLPIPKYQGAIIGSSIYPSSSIVYNSETYILNGGSFNAGMETWEGEWFKVSTARASVYEIENAVEQTDGSTTDLIRSIGGLNNDYSNVNDLFIKGGQVMTTESATTDIYPFSQTLFGDTDGTELLMPPAADWVYQGRSCEITVINNCGSASDEVTITPDGTETINGDANLVLTRFQSVIIVSDGSNLFLKSAYLPT